MSYLTVYFYLWRGIVVSPSRSLILNRDVARAF